MVICNNKNNCPYKNANNCKYAYPINYTHIHQEDKLIVIGNRGWRTKGTYVYCNAYMNWMEVKIWKP